MEMISQTVPAAASEYELQTGVFTGAEYPLSNRMKTQSLPLLASQARSGSDLHDCRKGPPSSGGQRADLPRAW